MAVLIVVAIALGLYLRGRGEGPVALVTASPSMSPTAAATTASPTATPASTSDPTVARFLKPLVSSWRPADTTVIVARLTQPVGGPNEFTLVAIPAAGGTATPLITIPEEPKNWDVRRDGSAVAVAVDVGSNRSRLATWDLRSGVLRWITPEEADISAISPRWSPDGAFVYFGRARFVTNEADLGLFRVRADGTELRRIRAPLPPGTPQLFSVPQLLTEEGVLLWGRAYEGTSLEALDLASGRERSDGSCAEIASWRPTQPRALVLTGACGIGHSGFGLDLWNDVTGATSTLADTSTELTLGADWDLSGTRIVAALRPASGSDPSALVTMDATGGSRTRLQGTENARDPLWLRAGIAYLWSRVEYLPEASLEFSPPYELRLVAPSGGTARTLYRSDDQLVEIRFVRP